MKERESYQGNLALLGDFFLNMADHFFNVLVKYDKIMAEQNFEVPWEEQRGIVIDKGVLFEVYCYFLFRLDWLMHNEKRSEDERAELGEFCESLVLYKSSTEIGPAQMRALVDNRLAVYADTVGYGEDWAQCAKIAHSRFEQFAMRSSGADTIEPEQIPAPIYHGRGLLALFPFKMAAKRAEERFGMVFEFGLRHVLKCCRDVRSVPLRVLDMYLASGIVEAEEIVCRIDRETESKEKEKGAEGSAENS
jgi:hypothetical protein